MKDSMIEGYDELHNILDRLISLNIKRRNEFHSFRENMDNIAYAHEFCTVRCDVGRRSGKTEYIKRRANSNDLVIVPYYDIGEIAYSGYNINISCPNMLKKTRPGIYRYNIIYLDEPSMILNQIELEEIYNKLALGNQTFVLLGS